MLTTRDIFLAFVSTVAGVWAFENVPIGFLLVCVVILSVLFVRFRTQTFLAACAIGLVLGSGAALIHHKEPSMLFPELVGQKIEGEMEVRSVKRSFFGFRYTSDVYVNSEKTGAIVDTYDTRELKVGNTAHFSGTLELPEAFENEYGKTFDYPNYLRSKEVFFVVQNAKLTEVVKRKGLSLDSTLESIRLYFEGGLEKVLHEPAASLSEGILVGDKGAMLASDSDMFRKAGIIHIIVLSGYNISVVAAFMMSAFSRFGRKKSLIFAGLGVVFFVLVTGASATAVRAGAMGLLAILGNFFRREVDALRLLAFAGIAMVMFSPLLPLYDPSFQLSFLATFGLIVFSPFLTEKFFKVPKVWGLREIAAATVATQAMTLPFLAHSMGAISVVSFFTNLFVLPVMPFLMLISFMTGILSLLPALGFVLSFPFAFITNALTAYVFSISRWFASLPFAMLNTSIVTGWVLFLVYIILIVFGLRTFEKGKTRD